MKLRELFKVGVASVAAAGAFELYRRVRLSTTGPLIHVLGYHRVVESIDPDGPVNPSLCITTEAFRRQMEQVKRRFTVLSLEQALAAIDGRLALDRDACAITFDDGYYDVLARAQPVLADLGIPATVFVPSGYCGGGRYLTHDRLYAGLWQLARRGEPLARVAWSEEVSPLIADAAAALTAGGPAAAVDQLIGRKPARVLETICATIEHHLGGPPRLDRGAEVLALHELRALADAGWEIGAHTVDHVVLTHEPRAEAQRQLEQSKRDLERWSGRPVRYFAYCNGYHSRALVEDLKRLGYTGAVTTCDRPNRAYGDVMRVSRKVLWEGHARGLDGSFSEAVSAAHLHDLFGTLGLTRPVDGEVTMNQEVAT